VQIESVKALQKGKKRQGFSVFSNTALLVLTSGNG
jgi:hypothetical protein